MLILLKANPLQAQSPARACRLLFVRGWERAQKRAELSSLVARWCLFRSAPGRRTHARMYV